MRAVEDALLAPDALDAAPLGAPQARRCGRGKACFTRPFVPRRACTHAARALRRAGRRPRRPRAAVSAAAGPAEAVGGQRLPVKTIFVMVKCELGRSYDVADAAVQTIDATSEVHSISGQYDLMMKFYLDDEADIKKAKLAKKKAVAKAKKYFEEQKEKYQAPLESRGAGSLEDSEEYQAYKQYVEQAKTYQEEQKRRKEWFDEKTNEVFSDGFKGFEFSIDDKSYVYTPGDRTELKKLQQTPEAWLNKYLDDKGLVKDAAGYHKSLAVAMNPEKFARFFYEQGQANAVDDVMRKTKNINMSERAAPQSTTKGGLKIRAVNQDSGRGLKIKTRRSS